MYALIFIILYGFFKALTDLNQFWRDNKVKDWLIKHRLGEWYEGGNKIYPPGMTFIPYWIIALIKKDPEIAKKGADFWHTFDDYKLFSLLCYAIVLYFSNWPWLFSLIVAPYIAGHTFTLFSHYLFRKDPDGPIEDWIHDTFFDIFSFWKRSKYLKTF